MVIKAVLESSPGQLIMICCDDLQWGDKTSLSLISEILVSVGGFKDICSRCLFIGLLRDDEVDDNHPFTVQHSYIKMMTSCINTTEIKLPSLSKEDICDMLMSEFLLPQRYVVHLAKVVHMKTSGHALFVVELLNSLLRDSVITYSPQKRRYDWDEDTINLLQTGDGVAGLIASNLKSLPPAFQRVLQVLSCFGIQTDTFLLEILEDLQQGIISSLDTLVDKGILDRAGGIVIFTHDLILQAAYESIPMEQRKMLHLQVGEYLGVLATEKATGTIENVSKNLRQLNIKDTVFHMGCKSLTSSLVSLACDQLNIAGPELARVDNHKLQFAEWNLLAGKETSRQSDYEAALFYYSSGIGFLGDQCWRNHSILCLQLHEGAAEACYAIGEHDAVGSYTQTIAANVSLEDSVKGHIVFLKSLSLAEHHHECISVGLKLLNALEKFDIPSDPIPSSVLEAIVSTEIMLSKYSTDQILTLCEKKLDERVQLISKLFDAFYLSCYTAVPSMLPLIACEWIKYSLQEGVSAESALAFATYAIIKISICADFGAGQYYAEVVRKIIRKHRTAHMFNMQKYEIRPQALLSSTIDIWYRSPRDISQRFLELNENAKSLGQAENALFCEALSWRFMILGGGNLQLTCLDLEDRFKRIAKHNKHTAKHMLVDNFLLMELTGEKWDCGSALGCSISNLYDLCLDATKSKDFRLLYNARVISAIVLYWNGYYEAAETYSHDAWDMPNSKMPGIFVLYHIFFHGLIAFQLYRRIGDEKRLSYGQEAIEKVENWAHTSMAVFENKLLLLKAEYLASINRSGQALQSYRDSIRLAKDHGNIHEQGLAHELLGNHINLTNDCLADSYDQYDHFRNAYVCYSQWGAKVVAQRVAKSHDLVISKSLEDVQAGSSKRAIWNAKSQIYALD